MTTTRTRAHPERSAARGRVEGPLTFRRFPRLRRSEALGGDSWRTQDRAE
jgi:hypothetical protein